MQVMPGAYFAGLRAAGLDHLIEINTVTGNQMYHLHNNDVAHVIDIMGGKVAASIRLGVEVIEIEHWIDDYYVPTRYAEQIHAATGWNLWSIQTAPFGSNIITPTNSSGRKDHLE
jgi:hypothetical protein